MDQYNVDLLSYINEEHSDYLGQMDFDSGFIFWSRYLLEKMSRMFEWSGLPFDQLAVELPTLVRGFGGFTKDRDAGYVCVPGSLSGVSWFPFFYPHFTYAAPGCAGGTYAIYRPGYDSEVGDLGSVVIVNNNAMRLSVMPLIDRYASLLSHEDINITNTGVNMRYDAYHAADNDESIESIKKWRSAIFRGEFEPIVDRSLLANQPIATPTAASPKGQIHLDAIEARSELLRMFFSEIGVRFNREKRSNMIEAEVTNNDQLLLFNIGDMLKQREHAAALISERFGLNVTVKLSGEFDMLEDTPFDGDN